MEFYRTFDVKMSIPKAIFLHYFFKLKVVGLYFENSWINIRNLINAHEILCLGSFNSFWPLSPMLANTKLAPDLQCDLNVQRMWSICMGSFTWQLSQTPRKELA